MATLDVNQNLAMPAHQKDILSNDSKAGIKLCDFKSFLKMDTSALDPGRRFLLATQNDSRSLPDSTDSKVSISNNEYMGMMMQMMRKNSQQPSPIRESKQTSLPQIRVSGAEQSFTPQSPVAGYHHLPQSPSATFGSNSLVLSPIPALHGRLAPQSPIVRETSGFQPYSPCRSDSQYSMQSRDDDESISLHGDECELADVAIEKSLHEISMRDISSLVESEDLSQTLKPSDDGNSLYSEDQIVPHYLTPDVHASVASSPQYITGEQQFYGGQCTQSDSQHPRDVVGVKCDPKVEEYSVSFSPGTDVGKQPLPQQVWDATKHCVTSPGQASQSPSDVKDIQGDVEMKNSRQTQPNPIPGNHICTICGIEFKFLPNLSRHMRSNHKLPRPYKCDICSKDFTSSNQLQKHKRTTHQTIDDTSDTKDTVVCPICGIEYSQTYYRRVHQKFHNGVRYACQICGRAFTHPQNMWRHYKLHESPENYKFSCDLCGLACKSQITLRRHMEAKHKETKPLTTGETADPPGVVKKETCYNCSICQKEFASKQALYCHLRVHNKNKTVRSYDLSCGVCHKAYKVWGALKKHCNMMHKGLGLVENELKSMGDVDYPYVVVQQGNETESAMDIDVADALKNVPNETKTEAVSSEVENTVLHDFVMIATAVNTLTSTNSAPNYNFALEQNVARRPSYSDEIDIKSASEFSRSHVTAMDSGDSANATFNVPDTHSLPVVESSKSHTVVDHLTSGIMGNPLLHQHVPAATSQASATTSSLMFSPGQSLSQQPEVGSANQQTQLCGSYVKEDIKLQNHVSATSDQTDHQFDSRTGNAVQLNYSATNHAMQASPILYSAFEKPHTETVMNAKSQASVDNWNAPNQKVLESADTTNLMETLSQIRNLDVPILSTPPVVGCAVGNNAVSEMVQNNTNVGFNTDRRYGRPKGSKNKKRLVKDGKTYFQCEHCDELFLSRPGINNHLKSHKELQNYGKIPTSRMVRKMMKGSQKELLEKRRVETASQDALSVEHVNSPEAKENPKVTDVTDGLSAVINQYIQTLTNNEQVQMGNSNNIQAILMNAVSQVATNQSDLAGESPINNTVEWNPYQSNPTISGQVMSPIEEAFRIATGSQDGQDFLCASSPVSIDESFDKITVHSDEGYNSTELSDMNSEVSDSTGDNPVQSSNDYCADVNQLQSTMNLLVQPIGADMTGNGTGQAESLKNLVAASISSPCVQTNASGQHVIHDKAESVDVQSDGHLPNPQSSSVVPDLVKHQCPHCDAVFKKTAVLQKHIGLHMKQFASANLQA